MISSIRNPLVKRLRSLARRQVREASSLLLIEGSHLLQEALKLKIPPREIIATNSWLESNPSLLKLFPHHVVIHEVSPSVLKASITTVSPDGVAALLPMEALPKCQSHSNFILALDRLQDPGNLGTIFRTALAAEVDCIWLASGADALSPKVIRASAGAVLHMPFCRFGPSDEDGVSQLVENLNLSVGMGKQVVATVVPSMESNAIVPYWDLDWSKPTVLVLGNEGSGLHPLVNACCTNKVTLPHSSTVQSLNVASASVPLLLERQRARMTSSSHQT